MTSPGLAARDLSPKALLLTIAMLATTACKAGASAPDRHDRTSPRPCCNSPFARNATDDAVDALLVELRTIARDSLQEPKRHRHYEDRRAVLAEVCRTADAEIVQAIVRRLRSASDQEELELLQLLGKGNPFVADHSRAIAEAFEATAEGLEVRDTDRCLEVWSHYMFVMCEDIIPRRAVIDAVARGGRRLPLSMRVSLCGALRGLGASSEELLEIACAALVSEDAAVLQQACSEIEQFAGMDDARLDLPRRILIGHLLRFSDGASAEREAAADVVASVSGAIARLSCPPDLGIWGLRRLILESPSHGDVARLAVTPLGMQPLGILAAAIPDDEGQVVRGLEAELRSRHPLTQVRAALAVAALGVSAQERLDALQSVADEPASEEVRRTVKVWMAAIRGE
jgi:hypothetical protein